MVIKYFSDRYDMKIPDFVIDSLDLNNLLDGIVTKLETIMGKETLASLHLL